MNPFFICPQNVVKTAQRILELDYSAIEGGDYKKNAIVFRQLKDRLEQYVQVPVRELKIETVEAQLTALMACVKACVPYLAPEVRQQLITTDNH